MHLILSGIVGSVAYGLARPGSDIDRLGVYAAPTIELHGLRPPIGKYASKVTPGDEEDVALHEAGKYAALALGVNPAVTELMWLPADLYETRTPLGEDLISIRESLLSKRKVRDSYLGYAARQFRRLEARGDGSFSADTRHRTAKHARHLARLLTQGLELYSRCELNVRLADPDWYHEFGDRVAEGDLAAARAFLARVERTFDERYSPLPERPDETVVEEWLHAVRAAHYIPPRPRPAARPWLVDVDGTIALRDEQVGRTPYDWNQVGSDLPNPPVIYVVRALAAAGHPIVYLSGRSEECRAATSAWIASHLGVPGQALLMRTAGDHRPDTIIKAELYERQVLPRFGEAAGVLDDRNSVVAMWRARGLTVLQVAEGDF